MPKLNVKPHLIFHFSKKKYIYICGPLCTPLSFLSSEQAEAFVRAALPLVFPDPAAIHVPGPGPAATGDPAVVPGPALAVAPGPAVIQAPAVAPGPDPAVNNGE